ncbi:Lrp/AsnC family transcriptional regulator [Arthrobacter sp. Z1-15]
MPDSSLSALDLRIVNALQIAPRAAWSQLAPILGADAATLNRRWRDLYASGTAWISTFDPDSWEAGALVEINCHSGANLRVAAALAETPEAIGVDLTAGGRDIVATIAPPSAGDLWTYLLEELPRIEGIESTHSHPIARNVYDGSAWRVRALDALETQQVQALAVPGRGRGAGRKIELEREITGVLNSDSRASATEIGAVLGESPRHVRETLAQMSAAGRLQQRTDLVRAVSGWPVSAWYFLRVPASKLDGVTARLQHLDELRLVSHTVGPYDLIMGVWLKSLAEVQRLEKHLEVKLPGVSTADRSVVLRSVKQFGQILDHRGYATGRNNSVPALRNRLQP